MSGKRNFFSNKMKQSKVASIKYIPLNRLSTNLNEQTHEDRVSTHPRLNLFVTKARLRKTKTRAELKKITTPIIDRAKETLRWVKIWVQRKKERMCNNTNVEENRSDSTNNVQVKPILNNSASLNSLLFVRTISVLSRMIRDDALPSFVMHDRILFRDESLLDQMSIVITNEDLFNDEKSVMHP